MYKLVENSRGDILIIGKQGRKERKKERKNMIITLLIPTVDNLPT
jgi:hypothetical protein